MRLKTSFSCTVVDHQITVAINGGFWEWRWLDRWFGSVILKTAATALSYKSDNFNYFLFLCSGWCRRIGDGERNLACFWFRRENGLWNMWKALFVLFRSSLELFPPVKLLQIALAYLCYLGSRRRRHITSRRVRQSSIKKRKGKHIHITTSSIAKQVSIKSSRCTK